MIRTTSRTCLSRYIFFFLGPLIKKKPSFDLSVRIQTQSMEDQALSVALEAIRKGKCIAILDSKSKEVKIDLFFLATFLFPLFLRSQRIAS